MTNFLKKRSKRGISLTEIIVATALVALAIGGIISVLVQGMNLGQNADYSYVAVNIAKNRIERIREIRKEKGYTALVDTAESDTIVNRNGVSDPTGEFMRTTEVSPNYGVNLTRVTVKVRYKKKLVFIPESIELVTLVSPYS